MSVVLDSSAILALVFQEPGGEAVGPWLAKGLVSSVNLAEIVTRLVERGYVDDEVVETMRGLSVEVMPFTREQALAAGLLRRATREAGLSLGDCACLALAQAEGLPAMTADRAWGELDLGIEVELIR